MYHDFGNDTHLLQPDGLPGFAGVAAFEYTFAVEHVGRNIGVAGARVHHIRVGRIESEVADGDFGKFVEHGMPVGAAVGGFENAACRKTGQHGERIIGFYNEAVDAPGDVGRSLQRPVGCRAGAVVVALLQRTVLSRPAHGFLPAPPVEIAVGVTALQGEHLVRLGLFGDFFEGFAEFSVAGGVEDNAGSQQEECKMFHDNRWDELIFICQNQTKEITTIFIAPLFHPQLF